MSTHNSVFFKNNDQKSSKLSKNDRVIAVGGEQLHAAAVALIDYLQNDAPIYDAAVKKISTGFTTFFPHYLTNNVHFKTADKPIKYVLTSPPKLKLVECMAYVLRQLIIDELYKDYLNLNYREVFAHLLPTTPMSYLRQPETPLPVCAFDALSCVLEIPITLFFTESGKELRKREQRSDNQHSALQILVENNKYYPLVKHPEHFAYVGQLTVVVEPVALPDQNEGNLANLLARLKEDNQDRLHRYLHERTKILIMVQAGELSRSQLIDHYITLLPTQMNTTCFIKKLEQTLPSTGNDTAVRVEHELAAALASWIVAGAIKEEQLYDRIETIHPSILAP